MFALFTQTKPQQIMVPRAAQCPFQRSTSSCGDTTRTYVSQPSKQKPPLLYVFVQKRRSCSKMSTKSMFPEGNLLADFALKDRRDSDCSEDSGTERHRKESDSDDREQPQDRDPTSAFSRRNAFKNMKAADKLTLVREKIEAFPGSSPVHKEDSRRHAARVVVMGDDRVLGRLARAYHSIR